MPDKMIAGNPFILLHFLFDGLVLDQSPIALMVCAGIECSHLILDKDAK
jgi:hypothetical protein